MIAVSNIRWRSLAPSAEPRRPWSAGYAHNGRRACVAVGTVDPPPNPEASSTRAVKIIGPQGLYHISSYSRRCDVAVDHPADHHATLLRFARDLPATPLSLPLEVRCDMGTADPSSRGKVHKRGLLKIFGLGVLLLLVANCSALDRVQPLLIAKLARPRRPHSRTPMT